MKVEILAIGNEVLEGFIVNTNAAFISQELAKEGFLIARHTVLPDDVEILMQGLKEALARSDVVITTGGLGPTCDDLTRSVAAKLFDSGFHYEPKIAEDLEKRYGGRLLSIKDQATVPDKAQVMPNPIGTAPGFIFQAEQSILLLLPGVPPEMKLMLREQAIPFLHSLKKVEKRQFRKEIHFFEMSESMADPALRLIEKDFPGVKAGIYPNLGLLTIHLVSANGDQLKKPYELLLEQFKGKFYDAPSLVEAVHHKFITGKMTLSTAESCTGGALAARLTKVPGASNYFMGGVIPYSNELKMNLLGVSPNTLTQKGAVSEEVAVEMVEGLLRKTNTDYGIAITGIAGPTGGSPEKPVGTCWAAISAKGKKTHAWQFRGYGSREMIIDRAVNALLAQLYLY